jgi:hypothetical protein
VPPSGTILAMAPDYATQRIAYVLPAALTLRLIPGSVVAGTVVRPDTGEPVEGIEVRVGDKATISDEKGRFTVRGLAPGIHKVMARGKAGSAR